jgi:phage terminase small subunit
MKKPTHGDKFQIVVSGQNQEVVIKEYQGQRVVTLKDVDEVHSRPEGTARKRFNDNKDHFIQDEDFFVRNSDEAKREFNIVAPNGLTLLTESGYLMLVKSFTDDLAWQVQRQLVKGYFRIKEAATQISEAKTKRDEAMLINAKNRAAKTLYEFAKELGLSPESKQLMVSGISEYLLGYSIVPKPQIEKHYTATEIAEELGVSANRIGRISTKHNLKTDEFGMSILDKSAHSNKQVPSFVYNQRGRNELIKLVKELES